MYPEGDKVVFKLPICDFGGLGIYSNGKHYLRAFILIVREARIIKLGIEPEYYAIPILQSCGRPSVEGQLVRHI